MSDIKSSGNYSQGDAVSYFARALDIGIKVVNPDGSAIHLNYDPAEFKADVEVARVAGPDDTQPHFYVRVQREDGQ